MVVCWITRAVETRHRQAVNDGFLILKRYQDEIGSRTRGSEWRRVKRAVNPRACAGAIIRHKRRVAKPSTLAKALQLLADTLHDVMQPGFWNSLRQRLRVSTMVECRLGSVETGITQAFIQIVDCPKTDLAGDVTISLGPVNKFEPVVAKDEEDDYAA